MSNTTIRPPVRRRRWLSWLLSWLLGIVIFFAGLIVGIALTVIFAVRTLQYIVHHPENGPPRITAFLARKLDLDATQHDQVLSILSRHQLEIQAIRREARPKMDQQLDEVRSEIGTVLSDQQRRKWQDLFDQLRDRWQPPPPPAASPSGPPSAAPSTSQ